MRALISQRIPPAASALPPFPLSATPSCAFIRATKLRAACKIAFVRKRKPPPLAVDTNGEGGSRLSRACACVGSPRARISL